MTEVGIKDAWEDCSEVRGIPFDRLIEVVVPMVSAEVEKAQHQVDKAFRKHALLIMESCLQEMCVSLTLHNDVPSIEIFDAIIEKSRFIPLHDLLKHFCREADADGWQHHSVDRIRELAAALSQ